MLPKEKEIPSLIQQISNSGTKAGVSFLLFKPSVAIAKTNYSEIPVQIKVACGYHQLGKFLSNVGNLARIVNVPSIRIQTGNERSIEANLSAITYTVAKGKEVKNVPPRN
jgi:type IV pilus assembly protein PilO